MRRLAVIIALAAAPALAEQNMAESHADRITWPALGAQADIAPAPSVAVAEPRQRQRGAIRAGSPHADIITWECPKSEPLVN